MPSVLVHDPLRYGEPQTCALAAARFVRAEKALKDIVISIRRSAADRERRQIEEGMQEPSAEMLTGIMTARKELQALSKISFKLGDAEDPR